MKIQQFIYNIRRKGNTTVFLAITLLLAAITMIGYLYSRLQNLERQRASTMLQTEQNKAATPTAPYWQISLPDTQTLSAGWTDYEDKNIGFKFKYPSTKYILKPDGLDELNKREPGNTLQQSLGKVPPKIIKALRFDDGNYSGETYFTPFALWIYDNSEKLNPEEWWKKYTYFPFLVGSARVDTGTVIVDNEPATYSFNYFGSWWYDFYIAKGNKIFLFHVEKKQYESQSSSLGLQILSTFKFIDQDSTTAGWKIYTARNHNFSFEYPSSWIVGSCDGETISLLHQGNFNCGSEQGSDILISPINTTEQIFLSYHKDNFDMVSKNISVGSNKYDQVIGYIKKSVQPAPGYIDLKIWTFIPHDTNIYLVSYDQFDKNGPSYQDIYQRIVSTFKFF